MAPSISVNITPQAGGISLVKIHIADFDPHTLAANGDLAVYNLPFLLKSAQIANIRAKVNATIAGTVTDYKINSNLRDVTNTLNGAVSTLVDFTINGTGTGLNSSAYSGLAGNISSVPVTTTNLFEIAKQFAIVLGLTEYVGTGNVTVNSITADIVIVGEVDEA